MEEERDSMYGNICSLSMGIQRLDTINLAKIDLYNRWANNNGFQLFSNGGPVFELSVCTPTK